MALREPEFLAASAADATQLGDEFELPLPSAMGRFAAGRLEVENARFAAGIVAMQTGLAAYRSTGQRVAVPGMLAMLADSHMTAGDLEAAAAAIEEGKAIARVSGEIRHVATLYRVEGEIHRIRGASGDARTSLEHAAELSRTRGERFWELLASSSLARLLAEQKEIAAARAVLGPIVHSIDEGHALPDIKLARQRLEALAPTS